jgi:transcriptional regulator with XRE-family HTH domain
MSTEHKKDAETKPTGRRYSSVDELIKGEGISQDIRQKVSEIEGATRLVEQLSLLRQLAGLTQEQMAERLGFNSQSAVSKLESGRDEEVTIGQITEYVKASGQRIAMMFGQPMSHVESVKAHALAMREHLSALASMAHQGDDIQTAVQAFFGEAFFNLLSIFSGCQAELPNGGRFDIRLEVMGKPTVVSRQGSYSRSTFVRETAVADRSALRNKALAGSR